MWSTGRRALALEVDDYEFLIDVDALWKPARVIVRRGHREAEFWLDSQKVELARPARCVPDEVERMTELVRENVDELLTMFYEMKNDVRRGRLEKRHIFVD